MRATTPVLFFLLLSTTAAISATAQQVPVKARPAPRTWSQEMRDKAEISLYQRHDCGAALLQANAAFDREMRHPDRMDPRIPLVKARAHECLGQIPEAVLSYAMYDRLAGVEPAQASALAGACTALLQAGRPQDSVGLARLTDSLIAMRNGIVRARDRNSTELFLRTASAIAAPSPSPPRWFAGNVPMDQGSITRNMGNEAIRTTWNAWYGPPYISPRTGYERHARERASDAELQLASALADVEARLLCLDPHR